MSGLRRFGVSMTRELLEDFDKLIKKRNYHTRSKAIEDLIRSEIVKREFVDAEYIAGAISLVYEHHRRELVNKITDIQHNFNHIIVSSQHIHLDKNSCLEIIAIKGGPKDTEALLRNLRSIKGIKNAVLNIFDIEK